MGVHNTCEDGVRWPPTRREETVMMIEEEFAVDCVRVRRAKGGDFGRGVPRYSIVLTERTLPGWR